MHGPDEGDVVEQGGPPLRLPGWARRPRWLPGPGGSRSRGAALVGLATLLVGLAAGYAVSHRYPGPSPRPATPASAPAAAPGPSAAAGTLSLFGLAQTGERPNRDRAAGRAP